MSTSVRTRFAPSPTGLLHLGNVRTALFNALAARAAGGAFVLRIEDTDANRSRPEWVDALCDDLRWLGLDWNEGPDNGGPHGPYQQSERTPLYAEYFDKLIAQGAAYPCFCTPTELALSRKAQLAAGQPPRYAGTCAHLSSAEVEARHRDGRESALRFRVPAGREVRFDDLVRGAQMFATDTIGDFIIRRTNGTPAFFFSNALDDALMGVTHVLRGDDHLANTPRQMLLLEAFGLEAPHYGHLGLLVGDDGAPLSKRHGSASLQDLRNDGYLPQAVLNYLARLGHHYENDPGSADFDKLAASFDLNRLGASPVHFDSAQLQHWQKEAVAQQSDADLLSWLKPTTTEQVPEADRAAFVQTIRDNIVLPEDAAQWAKQLYERPEFSAEAKEAMAGATPGFFEAARHTVDGNTEFKLYVKQLSAAAGVKGKGLYMPLRAALTGEVHGPELARVWSLLGAERIKARLQAANQIHSGESS